MADLKEQINEENSQFSREYADYQTENTETNFRERINAKFNERLEQLKAEEQGNKEKSPVIKDVLGLKLPSDLPSTQSLEKVEGVGKSVISDVTRGLLQAPRSALKGLSQGAKEMLELPSEIERMLNLPVFSFTNEKGEFDFSVQGRKELDKRLGKKSSAALSKIIPTIDSPKKDTVTGKAIENVFQFLAGFGAVGKVIKGSKAIAALSKLKGGNLTVQALKAASADMLAFDAQDDRLSSVIESVPALRNPITGFLQTDENDKFFEAKIKQGLEGIGLDLAANGFIKGLKAIKNARKVKKAAGVADDVIPIPKEEAIGLDLKAEQFGDLGDAASEEFIIPSKATQKLGDAAKETVGVTPKVKKEALTFDPKTGTKNFEINFARINGPEDIKNLMDDMVNNKKLFTSIDKSRRGVVPNAETLKSSIDIDGFDTIINRRVGEAFNAEQITAARMIYYDSTDKLMTMAKKASSPEATAIDQFNFRKMVAMHHAVQKEFMGVRAEAGRALQAWSMPLGGKGTENVRALEQVLQEFGGEDASKFLAGKIASMGDQLTTSQINQITQKGAFAKTFDAVREVWTLGLLTNPVTHSKNLTSNFMAMNLMGAERLLDSLHPNSPIKVEEGLYYFAGLLQSQKEAFKNGATAFRTGQQGIGLGKIELPRIRATAPDVLNAQGVFKPFGFAMDWYGRAMNIAGKALAGADEYAKTLLYKAQVKSLAFREGVSKGLDGDELAKFMAETTENPTSVIRQDAIEFAGYGTFTNALGPAGQAFQKILSQMPILRFAVPFVRTPGNIFKFTLERTPLAPVMKKVRDDLMAGGVRKQQALTRIGLGTSVMALATDFALNGKITGGGPPNGNTRQALMRTGWRPYSLKIGDTYYNYGNFEPVGTIFGLAADMTEVLSNYESYDMAAQRDIEEVYTAAIMAAMTQVTSKTYLRGLSDTVEVFSDPKRYGEQFLNRFAGSFVPAGVAAIERATSPELSSAFNMMDSIKSRIPGLSKTVPTRRNIWGEPIKTFYPTEESQIGATAERMATLFNPVYYTKATDSKIDRFLLSTGLKINMPSKIQKFDGIDIDLREYPEIYSRMVEIRGKEATPIAYSGATMHEFFNDLMDGNTPHSITFFSQFIDFDEQQQFITKIVSDYNKEAKKQLMEEFHILEQIIFEQREKQSGIEGNRGVGFEPNQNLLP